MSASTVTNVYADYAVVMLPMVFVSAGGLIHLVAERAADRRGLLAAAVMVAAVFEDANPTIESTTTRVISVVVVYVLIQQLEGNVLTPRIQGNALKVHPIIVLLAVIGGGELAGLAGVIFAVPAVAVLRVFFDFFRARLRMAPN